MADLKKPHIEAKLTGIKNIVKGMVESVNGKSGAVVLNADDVRAVGTDAQTLTPKQQKQVRENIKADKKIIRGTYSGNLPVPDESAAFGTVLCSSNEINEAFEDESDTDIVVKFNLDPENITGTSTVFMKNVSKNKEDPSDPDNIPGFFLIGKTIDSDGSIIVLLMIIIAPTNPDQDNAPCIVLSTRFNYVMTINSIEPELGDIHLTPRNIKAQRDLEVYQPDLTAIEKAQIRENIGAQRDLESGLTAADKGKIPVVGEDLKLSLTTVENAEEVPV